MPEEEEVWHRTGPVRKVWFIYMRGKADLLIGTSLRLRQDGPVNKYK